MGEHAAQTEPRWRVALKWVAAHRKAILGAVVLALPLVSRYVPGFPADEVVAVLRSLLGT